MCGIAGWIDFERDLTREQSVVQAMTHTLRSRGPDGEGLWVAPHAALGHRRLAIIDLERGRQPMVAEAQGRASAVLVYSGEVYNFQELRSELTALGHVFHSRSDTEVVLRAWQQWGTACTERLQGMFAFALWDIRQQELFLVRDRLGVKPLYYQVTPTGVLFGSEPKAILANPLARAVMDEEGLCQVLAFVRTPGRTPLRDLRELRPGHMVTVGRWGIRERAYWRLEARPHTHDLKTTVGNIRALLEDIVTRQLISDVPVCTLLSGGLDSSAITALAQRAVSARSAGPVRSFSVDFVNHAQNFAPDVLRATPDAPFVADVVRHVGSQHADIVLSSQEMMEASVRDTVLRARDLPECLGDMDTSMYLLFRAIRQHSTVALSGESADEVFGGYAWFHEPRIVAAPTFPWMAMLRLRGTDREQTLPLKHELFQRLQLGRYTDACYQQALAGVPRLEGESGLERRMRELSSLHLTHWLPMLLDRKDRMSMATGLEVRVPFCDHRLVEYLYNVPWSMKTFDGREKSLLRAAIADVLPRSVVERRKSPYPTTQDPAYAQALGQHFSALIEDPHAPVRPLIDPVRARAMAQGVTTATDQFSRAALAQMLALNAWLKRYEIHLAC